jgi:multiple sugar transport system ATP-binding protein
MPHVEFRKVRKSYPNAPHPAVIDLNLAVFEGEFLCILGPSGCGKSSTLRMLAGLETITAGDLLLDGERINDRPPQDRDMAMVFENYALYPHLRVFENIAMPLTARRLPKAEIRERVAKVAEMLQIADLLGKMPHTLSGGQRQRVALGRALVRTPRMFLMDEPLGHLEAYLRVQLRTEIRRLHEKHGVTTVYITHDQEEAAAISDRIAVMSAGQLQQLGSLLDLMDRPVNRFVAAFIGDLPINLLPAERTGETLRVGDLLMPLPESASAHVPSGPVEIGIRPQDVHLAPDAKGGASVAAHVALVEPQGDRSVIVCETQAGRINTLASSELAPAPGDLLRLAFDPDRLHVFAPDGVALLHGIGGAA